ncbi:MAG: hypothetical protein REJ23_04450 [Brevundimonas sp.]|nr:hypothetical protein [Brevundimonas sp.]
MDGSWLFLLVGPFLAVVLTRDVLAAWKHQCFRKGPSQLFDVARATKPITFWFLIVANIVIVLLGVWLTGTTAIDLFGQAQHD